MKPIPCSKLGTNKIEVSLFCTHFHCVVTDVGLISFSTCYSLCPFRSLFDLPLHCPPFFYFCWQIKFCFFILVHYCYYLIYTIQFSSMVFSVKFEFTLCLICPFSTFIMFLSWLYPRPFIPFSSFCFHWNFLLPTLSFFCPFVCKCQLSLFSFLPRFQSLFPLSSLAFAFVTFSPFRIQRSRLPYPGFNPVPIHVWPLMWRVERFGVGIGQFQTSMKFRHIHLAKSLIN